MMFYGCNNLNIIFRSTHRINSLFPYKDRFNRYFMSKVVYKASFCDNFYKVKRRVDYITEKKAPTETIKCISKQPERWYCYTLDQ